MRISARNEQNQLEEEHNSKFCDSIAQTISTPCYTAHISVTRASQLSICQAHPLIQENCSLHFGKQEHHNY